MVAWQSIAMAAAVGAAVGGSLTTGAAVPAAGPGVGGNGLPHPIGPRAALEVVYISHQVALPNECRVMGPLVCCSSHAAAGAIPKRLFARSNMV